ncbi:MAG: glucose-6-phosphate isomerase [Myxococcota bacterium]|jgi:glucose-6-phosphate isomerase
MFDRRILRDDDLGLILDLTDAPEGIPSQLPDALQAMAAIEDGLEANEDEGRLVGHYWLRAPHLAPTDDIRASIVDALAQVRALSPGAHTDLLWIGIGGSALGPKLVADCLAGPTDALRVHFLDNTDPDGFERILGPLTPAKTLVVVVSKSGGTVETRNGLIAAQAVFEAADEPFAPHAIAITGEGSKLWEAASEWQERVPMWDWVGGRTSITGTVGTVMLALCGWDLDGFLDGAARCDALTRRTDETNPAAALAAAWYTAGGGRGDRALVIEPYRDRFALLSSYLQQLVMESLGKRLDRQGNVVHQGLTVYGNRGSTDQHAFVQQLRDGRDDAFVHFVETRDPGSMMVGVDGSPSADHLLGFLYGTRSALSEAERPSLTIQVPDASARSLGVLIALFERAVGLYAELIDVNAYHQPGVEAGKKAAGRTLALLERLAGALSGEVQTAGGMAEVLEAEAGLCWRLLHHLAATGRAVVVVGGRPAEDGFSQR